MINIVEDVRNTRLKYLQEVINEHPEEEGIRARQVMECDYICGKIIERIKREQLCTN